MPLLAAAALVCPPAPAASNAGGTPIGGHPAPLEEALDAHLQQVMKSIYRSQLGEARQQVDAARRLAPADPRVDLLEARLLRETFPDQNASLGHSATSAAPIHACLERAIVGCDSILDGDPARGAAFLYRGWARLFASQMHALNGEMWSAARDAKRGRADIERALEWDPDNADGRGVLGTYLYFADLLPRVAKLARALAGVPGGDRQRGLALLHDSAAGSGYNHLDASGLLGAIMLGFEGDFTAARRTFSTMLQDFPDNPRLTEPLAALELFDPEATQGERTEAIARFFAAHPEDWYRQLSQRLSFYRALQLMLAGRVDEAVEHLEIVYRAQPLLPDWFPNDVAICLAEMNLQIGNPVPPHLCLVPGTKHTRQVTARWRAMQQPDARATPEEAAAFRRAQRAAAQLAAGELQAARDILGEPGSASDPAVHFYQGEIARRDGDAAQAHRHYEQLTERTLPVRWRVYRKLAFARRAELLESSDPVAAGELLGRALADDEVRDLLRHLLRARQRYYQRRAAGDVLDATTAAGRAPQSSVRTD